MSIFRSILIICLITLIVALGLLFFGSRVGYEEFRGGYAVLSTDISTDDKMIHTLLDKGEDYFGGAPVSESSQWVLLDEFDSLRMIPLDKYFSRVFYFDPRNDGYAEKLRDIFIQDDKRYVYIPLKTGNWNSNFLNKQFNELLDGISFSIEYFGIGRPLNLFFLAYAAASLIFLIFYLINKKHKRRVVSIIVLIPVLSSLAFFGASGIACAALLFAFFLMLKEPLDEYSVLIGDSGKKKNLNLFYKEIILPYRFYWILLPLFVIAFSVLIIFSQLKPIFIIVVFAAALIVFAFSMRVLSLLKRVHKRFMPVLIIKRSFPEFKFPFYMLPFIAAAVFVIFSAPYMSAAYDSAKRFDTIISEDDYHDHLYHQVSFSTRKIGRSGSYAAFPNFFIDTDGLPSMEIIAGANYNVNINNYPPFPLKQLMDFFIDINSGQKANAGIGSGGFIEKASLLVLLLFFIPYFFTGKTRLAGINWNMKSLYNKRNQLRVQKDA
ncbi:MAG: hypothetical protein FWD24_01415 [Treponema sp.]|nr:hypothetical protein [Treponema sp.]